MFCAWCLRSFTRRPASLLSIRTYAVNPNVVNQAKPLQSSTPGGEGPPAATSTSAAQPFSTPLTPAPVKPAGKVKNAVVSGTKAGTPLKNINYFKGKPDPIALEDSEYPGWLWTLLDNNKVAAIADGGEVGDLYSKSKKERRVAKKRAEKLASLKSQDPEIRVPINEQTIDLPFTTSPAHPFKRVVAAVGGVGENRKSQLPSGAKAGAKAMRPSMVEIGGDVQVSAEEAAAARLEVRKEIRKKSRAAIKEKNFLSTLGR